MAKIHFRPYTPTKRYYFRKESMKILQKTILYAWLTLWLKPES